MQDANWQGRTYKLATLGLALVAAVPRLWQLGQFITPDETLFLDYARDFLRGLAHADLSLTWGLGYPGVPLVWVNSLGLWMMYLLSRAGLIDVFPSDLSLDQFLDGRDILPLPYYIAARVGTVLLVSVLLVLVYLIGRRLFGDRVALFSALLLAFDPSYLGYARLVHMAVPLALFMGLSVLAWLAWLNLGCRKWLILSGVFAGLAVLTITMGLLVPPAWLAMALLRWLANRRPAPAEGREPRLPGSWWGAEFKIWALRVARGWLLAMLIMVATFWAIWPAMWTDPVGAVWHTLDWLWKNANVGFGNWGMFWMGTSYVLDPGPSFYPVTLLLRISPLMLIGTLTGLIFWRRARYKALEGCLWLYVLFFFGVMTFGPTKSVRYLLPPMAALAFLASLGWWRLGEWLSLRLPFWRRAPRAGYLVWGGIFSVLLLVSVLPYAPYYLSYYNPLVLGWQWAPRAIQVGWGEGLDVAARYLNQQPQAERKKVAAWYDWTFAPFFVGQTLPFSTENALHADYSVLYINQVQRANPDPNLIAYFRRRRPEHVVHLNGIDYAWVYPAMRSDGPLPPETKALGIAMDDAVTLEGYALRPAPAPEQGLVVSLYWRAQRSDLPEYFVYVRAVDTDGQVCARADAPPVMNFYPTTRWQAGQLIEDAQLLRRPADTPPGRYRLEVGMYDPVSWAVLEPASGERGEGGGVILGVVELP